MFGDSPGIQSCKELYPDYFSAVHNEPKSVTVMAQQTKMVAIDSLNFGSKISQLIAGESEQHGAHFGMFLK